MTSLGKVLFTGVVTFAMFLSATLRADELYSYQVINLQYPPKNAEPWYSIITTQDEWQAFYAQAVYEHITPIKAVEAPRYDFTAYQLIVGGLGAKPTLGYSLALESVKEAADAVVINVLDISLAQGCSAGTALSYPNAAILIKKTDKPLRVQIAKAVKAC